AEDGIRDRNVTGVQTCALSDLGWLPSMFFWHRLIHQLGGTSSRLDVARSFFTRHLGKYVPGKASVLLIRAGLLADRGCRPGVAEIGRASCRERVWQSVWGVALV